MKQPWPLRTGGSHRRYSHIDEEGYFTIVDRKKDMIISGGFNIYPRDVDEVLFSHPKVLEGCAIGVPDQYSGERIKAFVVLKPGETASADEIIDYCKENLVKYKVPKYVEFVQDLPKSAVGKILRKELRTMDQAKAQKEGEDRGSRRPIMPCQAEPGNEGKVSLQAFSARPRSYNSRMASAAIHLPAADFISLILYAVAIVAWVQAKVAFPNLP